MQGSVDHICFAIFVAHYQLYYEKEDENDSQPDETLQEISKTLPKS